MDITPSTVHFVNPTPIDVPMHVTARCTDRASQPAQQSGSFTSVRPHQFFGNMPDSQGMEEVLTVVKKLAQRGRAACAPCLLAIDAIQMQVYQACRAIQEVYPPGGSLCKGHTR